jgi:hypothetical protein
VIAFTTRGASARVENGPARESGKR